MFLNCNNTLGAQCIFFHSANSLTLNDVCIAIKNHLTQQYIGDNKIYYKSDISN